MADAMIAGDAGCHSPRTARRHPRTEDQKIFLNIFCIMKVKNLIIKNTLRDCRK